MSSEIYQWIIPVIASFYFVRTCFQFMFKQRHLLNAVIWALFWLFVFFLALFPDYISNPLAKFLGFKSNINAVIFLALGIIFLFIFYLSARVEKLESQLTEIVRKLAMDQTEQKEQD